MSEMPADMPEATRRAIAENDLALEEKLGIKKGEPMDVEKADKQSANPDLLKGWAYQNNCATCCPTYMMRERGFDVIAEGNFRNNLSGKASSTPFAMWQNADGSAVRPTGITEWMKDKNYASMTAARYREFLEGSCKEPGVYSYAFRYKGKTTAGHITILKRGADGSLSWIEPQQYISAAGILRDIEYLCKAGSAAPTWGLGVLRIDDKLLDPAWASLFRVVK
jgi:hypothetical protein